MQVTFLGYEHNPDLMLLAARALTFLADVFPPACASIIRHGAVPAFCARLLTIEYIDLAEQSLQALEKLSHEHPGSLLRNGALVAVLSYIDFFQTGVQRVAVATAANICRGLTADYNDAVSTAAPILIGLLSYQVRGRWWAGSPACGCMLRRLLQSGSSGTLLPQSSARHPGSLGCALLCRIPRSWTAPAWPSRASRRPTPAAPPTWRCSATWA